jgi:MbtH protein
VNYRVLVNADGQYSTWPADTDIPAGWFADGTAGTREECLDHIERVWTDPRPARPWIRTWLAEAVSAASDGELSPAAVLAAGCSFTAMGVPSLAMVRLVDAIEMEFDVTVDFDSGDALSTLDTLTDFVATQRLPLSPLAPSPADHEVRACLVDL